MAGKIINDSLTNRKTAKHAGRRVAGSYGRATHKLRSKANRAVRRVAKILLKKDTHRSS